jgi:carboxyl-terminal processing protease
MIKRTSYLMIIPGIFFLALLFACTKTLKKPDEPSANSFTGIFDMFWNGINNNYLYWDTDTTDWKRIYHQYHPKFAELDYKNPADIRRSVDYFRAMTATLLDGHFQVIFEHPVIPGIQVYPFFTRKMQESAFHFPFDFLATDSKYFKTLKLVYDSVSAPNEIPLRINTALLDTSILYFSCNKFSLSRSYHFPQSKTRSVLDSFFSRIHTPPVKGLIIDLRNNFGGDLSDLSFFLSRFIDTPLHIGYSQYKTGPNPLAHTSWIPSIVKPHPSSARLHCPIVILIDNFTVSLSETLALSLRLLPDSKIIGERSYGATGPVTSNTLYNFGGAFTIPGFLTAYMSASKFRYTDSKTYEGTGITPDITVPFEINQLNAGKDPQLETALIELNKK